MGLRWWFVCLFGFALVVFGLLLWFVWVLFFWCLWFCVLLTGIMVCLLLCVAGWMFVFDSLLVLV